MPNADSVKGKTRRSRYRSESVNLRQTVSVVAVYTTLVHNGVMGATDKVVRQSVTLPAKVVRQVRSMAKSRRVSASHMLVELVEEGIEVRRRKEKDFFELAGRFRATTDPHEAERLGDQLGRMVFGR